MQVEPIRPRPESKSAILADHDHDLVHDLSLRLDSFWRYDQYRLNAKNNPELQKFWERVKRQEMENIEALKGLVATEIQKDCF